MSIIFYIPKTGFPDLEIKIVIGFAGMEIKDYNE